MQEKEESSTSLEYYSYGPRLVSQLQLILKGPQKLKLHSDETHGYIPQITTALLFPLTHVAVNLLKRVYQKNCMCTQ